MLATVNHNQVSPKYQVISRDFPALAQSAEPTGAILYPLYDHLKFNPRWQQFTQDDRQWLFKAIARDCRVTGIGARTGAGGLFGVDLDDCPQSTLDAFLTGAGLPLDYAGIIDTASGIGYRVLAQYTPDDLYFATFGEVAVVTCHGLNGLLDHLELSRNHNNVVAGQVINTKGPHTGEIGTYKPRPDFSFAALARLTTEQLIAGVQAVASLPSKVVDRQQSTPVRNSPKTINFIDSDAAALARQYIDIEIAKLEPLADGRNCDLNLRSANVARLAHYLGNDQALKDELFNASVTNGEVAAKGERQTRATIESGWKWGLSKGERHDLDKYVKPKSPQSVRSEIHSYHDQLEVENPAVEPSGEIAQTANRTDYQELTEPRRRYRDGYDAAIYAFYPRKANNMCRVMRAVFDWFGGHDVLDDIPQFAKWANIPQSTVYAVLNEYELSKLIFRAVSTDSDFAHYSTHEGVQTRNDDGDDPAQSRNTQTGGGFVLLPDDEITRNFITRRIVPDWNRQATDPLPDEMLFEALGSSVNFTDLINARLEAAIPDRYKSAVKERDNVIAHWTAVLSDPTLTDLPGWQRSVTKAKAERIISACVGKETNWTKAAQVEQMPRDTLRRTAIKDWHIEPVIGGAIEVDSDDLPALESVPGKGYPTVARIWHEDGTFEDIPYARNRALVRAAVKSNQRVQVLCQTNFKPIRRKTDDEKQAEREAKRTAQVTDAGKQKRKPTIAAPLPKVYIDYSEAQARHIAYKLIERLGDRVVTADGEIIDTDKLTNSQLVQVMRGDVQEVIKMYTPQAEIALALNEIIDTSPADDRPQITITANSLDYTPPPLPKTYACVCVVCGSAFQGYHVKAQHCSSKCRKQHKAVA